MRRLLKTLAFVLTIVVILTHQHYSNAAIESTDAVVEIIVPVTITENLNMQFGKVTKPTSGTNVVTISTGDTRSLTGGGDATLVSGGTERAAQYTVNATASETLSIEVEETSSITGLSLDNFKGKYNGGADQDVDSGDGATVTAVASATLIVGGDLTIDNTASSGVNTLSFNLTVNYP